MNWLKRLFGIKDTMGGEIYYATQEEYESICQAKEDYRITKLINSEANTLFREWLKAPEYEFNGKTTKRFTVTATPFATKYTIYHIEKAIYKNINISDKIWEQFNFLKAAHKLKP